MATAKTTALTFRIEPGLKEAPRTAAREHRSIVNRVEVLIQYYSGRNGIAILEQDDLFNNGPKAGKRRWT